MRLVRHQLRNYFAHCIGIARLGKRVILHALVRSRIFQRVFKTVLPKSIDTTGCFALRHLLARAQARDTPKFQFRWLKHFKKAWARCFLAVEGISREIFSGTKDNILFLPCKLKQGFRKLVKVAPKCIDLQD